MQEAIFGRFDTWYQVGRGQGNLFGLLEKVADIAIEDHLPDLALGNIRPDLGWIQRIEIHAGQLLRFEGLNVQVPLRVVAAIDRVHQVGGHVAEVMPLDLGDFTRVEVFLALQSFPAELHVGRFTFGVDELVGMDAVAVHVPVTQRSAFVGIQ
ncbi:hypothetical protein D3C81_1728760 [compost metagenome]